MRSAAIVKLLGILLMLFSFSMLPPIFVSLGYHDHSELSFLYEFFVVFGIGFILWLPVRKCVGEFKTRDGFLVVVLVWVVLSFFGAIPLYFNYAPTISLTDSIFESVSGLTTTGATVINNVDGLPRAILYYRQQLHLLGGLGIIVLAIAVLPMLGIGGMQLYRAETVGAIKNYNIRPRITETAKALWYVYGGLVLLCAIAYKLAGMTYFDAIGESFSTVSTGGFTTHNNSFAFYHSDLINCIAIFFMIMGAVNFTLHYQVLRQKSLAPYNDPEFKGYLRILVVVALICIVVLLLHHYYFHPHSNIVMNSIFTVVSLASTTGFTTSDFGHWPTFIPFLLMFVAMIGGCGGSTAGGIKVIRYLLLRKQGERELKHLIHPQAVMAIKFGKQTMPESIVQSVWGFIAIYVLLFVFLLLLLLATGIDMTTAFGVLAGSISNTGAAIGMVSISFHALPDPAKWILIFAMIAGRLEIFTLLVLFLPSYWRR